VWIKGDKEVLKERMEKRQGHFMKAQMLDSQFDALEPPEGEEDVVVVPLDASPAEQLRIARDGLIALQQTD
jgi:gluconokinase